MEDKAVKKRAPAKTRDDSSLQSNIAQRRLQARASGEKDYLDRREELLQAAGKIFKEKGFRGASIDQIAKEVGIDRASIYYYTSGKEELFRDIVQDATSSNIMMAEGIFGSDLPSKEKIHKLVTSLMQSYQDHYPYLYVYVQEDMTRIASERTAWAAGMRKLAKRFDSAVTSIIREGIANGAFRCDPAQAHIAAFAIIGMCNWSHRWFQPAEKNSAALVGETFARIVLSGLGSDRADQTVPVDGGLRRD